MDLGCCVAVSIVVLQFIQTRLIFVVVVLFWYIPKWDVNFFSFLLVWIIILLTNLL
jgi:hypothetical protein